MTEIIHGGDIYGALEKINNIDDNRVNDLVDFSANINPFGMPKGVINAIKEGLSNCVNYPDPLCRKLRTSIAKEENFNINNILCGNGAADIIFRIVLAIKPKTAMVVAPTFAEYEIALNTIDCDVFHYYLQYEKGYVIGEEIIDCMKKCDVIFLCNPNNPTGQLINRELILKILDKADELGSIVVIDECFIDFVEDYELYTLKPYIDKYKNLIILKAFTKSYAMPGLRLGYCISSNIDLLENIDKMGQPWSVSSVAQIAGIAALNEKQYIKDTFSEINKQKHRLVSELERLGIWYLLPAANYIFIKINSIHTREANEDFKDKLFSYGLMIRDCSNYIGLDYGYYRIAVKDKVSNDKLIKALEEILINFK